ncbi:amino acid ABC transporter permease [Herbaspirillum sp. 1130]|uniref:amino acid ABC transporter permease n=1 Tax=Herbaspirillum sp. 1130 TaxID=2806562 RepID=UPI001AE3BABE|nr:amino acid ABC transporter permease [Herbaspirillum sp. 1130]MBP1318278.1 polar amino acid transport system permease protein [Herbaspirillum sp. 1130]
MNSILLTSLLQGLLGTVLLSVLTFACGGALGFVLCLARISANAVVRGAASLYIQLVQGTPLLVLMGLCFFGPDLLGMDAVAPLSAATLAMSIYASAYLADIWRGCLQSVPRAQWEAAECLGLSRWQRMRQVILPQGLRLAMPPTVGFMVQIVKNTSTASLVVGFAELSYNAKVINNATFQPFIYFGLAGLLYFAVCYPLSMQARALERKLNVSSR